MSIVTRVSPQPPAGLDHDASLEVVPRGDYVLIVDDDVDLRHTLCDVLNDEQVATVGASNGQEALAHLQSNPPPRLILLDLMMPVMNGWQLAEALRKDARLTKIPVLIMTAGRMPSADQLPGYEIVRKPIELDQLLGLVRGYLR